MRSLIIPGVQKCGTSTLYAILSAHRQICPSVRSETEYFTQEGSKDLESYLRYFRMSDEEWLLDVSPGYFLSESAPSDILRIVPDVFFVFVFRDPVSRAYSSWKMQQTKGSDLDDFGRSLRLHPHYLEHGRYATHLQRFMNCFDKERMMFLRMEDLSEDPEGVLSGVSNILGIEPFSTAQTIRENSGGSPRSWIVSRGLNVAFRTRNALRDGPLASVVSNPVVDRQARRIRNRIARWNRVDSVDPGPDAEAVQFIRDSLGAEVRQLSEMTGLDLTRWLGSAER